MKKNKEEEKKTVAASPPAPAPEEEDCLLVGWLLNVPANMPVYVRDGSAQTIVRAVTLRQKLQIKRSTSPSHSILTPGQPVPVLTL